jgi:alpha-galactosidase/6-phospho-beta-glucosidase family protein
MLSWGWVGENPFKEIPTPNKYKKTMPITNASYQKYYAKNRDVLIEKMREKYDPIKKHEYYEEHKEQMKAAMAERYRNQKAERNRQMLTALLATPLPDQLRQKVDELLTTDGYKEVNKHFIKFIEKQVPSITA